MSPADRIVVTAGVVERDGEYLVTRRRAGVHLEGCWEFPGGKCEPDETLDECLRREMLEELGVNVLVGAELLTTCHDYADRAVELHFFACELKGVPQPAFGQEMRWVKRDELRSLGFPPADTELIELLAATRGPAPTRYGAGFSGAADDPGL
jgi:8-oxo-dGTP diphosphatase